VKSPAELAPSGSAKKKLFVDWVNSREALTAKALPQMLPPVVGAVRQAYAEIAEGAGAGAGAGRLQAYWCKNGKDRIFLPEGREIKPTVVWSAKPDTAIQSELEKKLREASGAEARLLMASTVYSLQDKICFRSAIFAKEDKRGNTASDGIRARVPENVEAVRVVKSKRKGDEDEDSGGDVTDLIIGHEKKNEKKSAALRSANHEEAPFSPSAIAPNALNVEERPRPLLPPGDIGILDLVHTLSYAETLQLSTDSLSAAKRRAKAVRAYLLKLESRLKEREHESGSASLAVKELNDNELELISSARHGVDVDRNRLRSRADTALGYIEVFRLRGSDVVVCRLHVACRGLDGAILLPHWMATWQNSAWSGASMTLGRRTMSGMENSRWGWI